ncbi:GyrI-like domain-containing protein [Actinoallomurus iriomotensis]|uniref:GyrI-like small molecule binding domain-containing protein n=1 Tax=Actinoallomurus iriomotensis TaxID=478107 RepID=A0A9W6VL69_9ACTN|nr:GyrI-like domain-containing protein [Actinoallomurus iriomotensis]GLY72395.1 hypothetical protein Airi01_006620 [Actinoallomurus iriomotensis]
MEPDDAYDFTVADLAGVASAATVVHHGPMEEVVATEQALTRWIDAHGHRAVAYARELHLECPPGSPGRWVTELQAPIESRQPAGSSWR